MNSRDIEIIFKRAVAEGLIENDPRWLASMEDPLPAWAVLDIAIKLIDKMNPPHGSYD